MSLKLLPSSFPGSLCTFTWKCDRSSLAVLGERLGQNRHFQKRSVPVCSLYAPTRRAQIRLSPVVRSPSLPPMEVPVEPRSVPVAVAKELIEAGHKILDVRTEEEYREAHVENAVNVPFMIPHGTGRERNEDFVKQVKQQFDTDTELVVLCRGGTRSINAVKELIAADYTALTDMSGGIVAWQESGFPVKSSKATQKL